MEESAQRAQTTPAAHPDHAGLAVLCSNGCAVGCPRCDGTSRGPIPGTGDKPPTVPPTGIGRNKVGPNGVVCTAEEGTGIKPTMCDPALRTVNVHAACGGPEDWYWFSPWRRPGAAPVIDACGVAGGHRPPDGPFGGIYVNTSHARLGDMGSQVLPPLPSNTVWHQGDAVEVTWTIEARDHSARKRMGAGLRAAGGHFGEAANAPRWHECDSSPS